MTHLAVEHGLEELGQFPAWSRSIPAIPRPRSGHAVVAKVVDYHVPESRDMLPKTEVGLDLERKQPLLPHVNIGITKRRKPTIAECSR